MSADLQGGGWQPTLAELDVWVEQADLPPKAQRRAEALRNSHRDRIRRTQRNRYAEDIAPVRERVGQAIDEARTLAEVAREFAEGIETGRIERRDAQRDLARLVADLNRARAVAETLRGADDDAWRRVSTAPEEYQSEHLGRFPMMRTALPTITDAHLTGEAPNPYEATP